MSKESDLELVRRALNKDQKAYSSLLSRYHDNIFYYILKMVGDKSHADDLTIESFDKAFQNLDKYNEQYAFSTWLYKIAKNCTIDFVRKRKLNSLHISYDPEENASINENTISSGTPNPEENMIQQQETMALMKHIESLKPKYRTLIELRYIKEYAYEEIAEELSIPLGTVKTRLFRAKNVLAAMILASPENEIIKK
ncbi:MAG: sigma-70 family RNA polymerase sigma factor [Prevotellaceae bacterium]|jgi:RNA polymerase sigma-70 factor (ECF subfamily)|nr:sigma-70 family RNA polymerase sigma factor [Prevotellaceae bacterium]